MQWYLIEYLDWNVEWHRCRPLFGLLFVVMKVELAVTIYWTGLLDWNTGLSYFPFLDKFLCLFIEINK